MCWLRGGRRHYDEIFSHTTTTQQSNCVGLQEAVGCAREQEAEAPADGRHQHDRWHSHWCTSADVLENKRRSVTRDDTITNRQMWRDKWRMVDER